VRNTRKRNWYLERINQSILTATHTHLLAGLTNPHAGVIETKPATAPAQKPAGEYFRSCL